MTVDFSLKPVHDESGRVVLLIPEGRPITEQKKAAEALRLSEERFRGAFDAAAIGMALVAPDGRWLQVNASLCQIAGYSEDELLGMTWKEITHPDDLSADLEQSRRLLAGEIPSYQMEKRYIHKDGHIVWIVLSRSLVRDAGGEPLHFVAQIEDITPASRPRRRSRTRRSCWSRSSNSWPTRSWSPIGRAVSSSSTRRPGSSTAWDRPRSCPTTGPGAMGCSCPTA